MGSIISSTGTVFYSLLCLNSRTGFYWLKYMYSVISVIVYSLAAVGGVWAKSRNSGGGFPTYFSTLPVQRHQSKAPEQVSKHAYVAALKRCDWVCVESIFLIRWPCAKDHGRCGFWHGPVMDSNSLKHSKVLVEQNLRAPRTLDPPTLKPVMSTQRLLFFLI